MPLYRYKAITSSGAVVRNKMEEVNRNAIIKKLKRNDLIPIEIRRISTLSGIGKKKTVAKTKKRNIKDIQDIMKNANTSNIIKNREMNKLSTFERLNQALLARTEKITTRDIQIFTQNFYLLKKANFNNIHALATIIESTENYGFREVLEDILAGVESGENMFTTMEYYEDIFPPIYISMIKVGELSGSLTNSLEQAITYLDETTAITRKLKSILIPNLIQFVLLIVMLIVGTVVAIPAIQNVFDALGSQATLPAITLWFQGFINDVARYWYIPVGIIAFITSIIVVWIRTPKGKYNFHYFKYVAPIFGKLIYSLDFSRLMRAMLLNLKNGMRIQDSLEISKNVVHNYVMLSMVETSINNILMGSSWIEPFERANLSSPMIIEMLKIGMKTDLPAMMERLLEFMQIDIDNTIQRIMKILPEVVYAIVGVVLIFFVIVVLVPCIQVYMGDFLFSAYGF